jgi:hypothetical protein
MILTRVFNFYKLCHGLVSDSKLTLEFHDVIACLTGYYRMNEIKSQPVIPACFRRESCILIKRRKCNDN